MKKTILVLYSSHNAGENVPFSDLKYQSCYEALYTLAEEHGLHMCRAPLSWYDKEKDIFVKAWEFSHGEWRISGPIKPDLVYDRTLGRSATDPIRSIIISRYLFLDDPAFTQFANNKYETSRLLPQYFKPYQKITSQKEFLEFLKNFGGDLLVIKPVMDSGGKGVHIVSKETAQDLSLSFPVIVQEFIDSSQGIPGITDTYHDLRLVFIGDELIYSYVRNPKKGSLLANLAQGGTMTIVPIEKLPSSLTPIIKDTARLFSVYQRKTYTIDIMFDKEARPWIIEFNTMPGMFFPPEEKRTLMRVYNRLLQELESFLDQPKPSLQKNITAVILFSPFDGEEKAAFRKKKMREAYTQLATLAQQNGVNIYRASTDWYDTETRSFRQAWHFDGTDWVLAYKIGPDVIYDKAADSTKTRSIKTSLLREFPFINSLPFTLHAGSKSLVSQAFRQFAKPYFIVNSLEELSATAHQIPGEKIVVKPDRGNSGEGIFIGEKKILAQQSITFPVLIQEFVDSSAGIPGIMQGLHDLRLIFSNETLLYAYYRTPKTGSYLANLAQGGKQTMVPPEDIPHAVWPVVEAVQAYYSQFKEKIYTIDLIFDPAGTPWIVELNTMPGLYPDESERPHISKLYLAIIEMLRRVSKEKNRG